MIIRVEVTDDDVGKRLDVVLAEKSGISRAQIKRLLDAGKVSSGGSVLTNASLKIKNSLTIDVLNTNIWGGGEVSPENIPLDVVYEDEDIIVINKPAGIVTHPSIAHSSGTLVNAIMHHTANVSDLGGLDRAGIVHRLDKDTSGLIVVAKNNASHVELARQFEHEKGTTLRRKYKCFCFGVPSPKDGIIDTLIGRHPKLRQQNTVLKDGGKQAITIYKTIGVNYITPTRPLSYIECELITGRTHQIRVHMKHLKCPIIGDPVYGKNIIERRIYPDDVRDFSRQALHAYYLEFEHPKTQQQMIFEAALPEDMLPLAAYFQVD